MSNLDELQSVAPEQSISLDDMFGEPDWSLLEYERPRPPRAPLAALAPAAAHWTQRHAEACSAPDDFVAFGLLAATAGVIGNTRAVEAWEGYVEPSALYVALMGDPSSGKTPAIKPVIRAVSNAEKTLEGPYEEAMAQYRSDLTVAEICEQDWRKDCENSARRGEDAPPKPSEAEEPVEPVRPRLLAVDATIEKIVRIQSQDDRGVFVVRDELGGFFGTFGKYGNGGDAKNSERGFFNQAYNGDPYVYDRCVDGTRRVERLTCSILGGVQPDVAEKFLLSDQDDGLAARFLIIWPDARDYKVPDQGCRHDALERAFEKLAKLELVEDPEGQKRPRILQLSPPALQRFKDWTVANEVYARQARGKHASHLGKFRGLTLRLALVLEHVTWAFSNSDDPPECVSDDAMASAIQIVEDYLRPMAERVYGGERETPEEKRAAALLRETQRRGARRFNLRTARREWKIDGIGANDAGAARSAANYLLQTGWILLADVDDPKTLDYVVHPALFGECAVIEEKPPR